MIVPKAKPTVAPPKKRKQPVLDMAEGECEVPATPPQHITEAAERKKRKRPACNKAFERRDPRPRISNHGDTQMRVLRQGVPTTVRSDQAHQDACAALEVSRGRLRVSSDWLPDQEGA